MTVIIALATRLRAVRHLRAGDDRDRDDRERQGTENLLVRALKALYRPALGARHPQRRCHPSPPERPCLPAPPCCSRVSARNSLPTLDEKNIVMEVKRIPSTSLTQSQAMQFVNERHAQPFPAGRVRLFPHRHAGPRGRSDAAERHRYLHHSQASGGMARSAPAQGRSHPGDSSRPASCPATNSASPSRSRCASTS